MERQVMLVLLFLIRRAGTVVTRDEILSALWSEALSNDDALTQSVSKLRKALGESAGDSRTIQTVRKVGYRLVGPVSVRPPECAAQVAPKQVPAPRPGSHRPWSWAAIAIVALVTGFNAVALHRTETRPQTIVKARAIIPGVDTTDFDLGSLADLKLHGLGNGEGALVLDSTVIAQVLNTLAAELASSGPREVHVKRVVDAGGGEE